MYTVEVFISKTLPFIVYFYFALDPVVSMVLTSQQFCKASIKFRNLTAFPKAVQSQFFYKAKL